MICTTLLLSSLRGVPVMLQKASPEIDTGLGPGTLYEAYSDTNSRSRVSRILHTGRRFSTWESRWSLRTSGGDIAPEKLDYQSAVIVKKAYQTFGENEVGSGGDMIYRVPIDGLAGKGIDMNGEWKRARCDVAGIQEPFILGVNPEKKAQPSIE
jgi:hypothetical protein